MARKSKAGNQRTSAWQTLVLWELLAKGGQSYQKDLRSEVTPNDREVLRSTGVITFEKRKRGAYWLEVTDRGWRLACDHLGNELPQTKVASSILQAWLTHLQAFMRASNTPLVEILRPRHETTERELAEKRTAPTDYGSLRERIRDTYLDLTGGSFNKRALLADIRRSLSDVSRNALDDELMRMQRQGDATLMQLDNRPDITQADQEAAIQIGQEPRHILWISR